MWSHLAFIEPRMTFRPKQEGLLRPHLRGFCITHMCAHNIHTPVQERMKTSVSWDLVVSTGSSQSRTLDICCYDNHYSGPMETLHISCPIFLNKVFYLFKDSLHKIWSSKSRPWDRESCALQTEPDRHPWFFTAFENSALATQSSHLSVETINRAKLQQFPLERAFTFHISGPKCQSPFITALVFVGFVIH